MASSTRKCPACHQRFPFKFFPFEDRHNRCKFCRAARRPVRLKRTEDLRYPLWATSYNRAKEKGIVHTIRLEDIELPTHCRYLGVELDYGRSKVRAHNNPSIDRIHNDVGYVPGNIQVISDLANRMKSDASLDEMVAFARGVLAMFG